MCTRHVCHGIILVILLCASPVFAGDCLPGVTDYNLHAPWRWMRSIDWYTDAVETPQSVGHTYALVLHPSGLVTDLVDGKPAPTREWCLRRCDLLDELRFGCRPGERYLWIGWGEDTNDGQGWYSYRVDVQPKVELTLIPLVGTRTMYYAKGLTVSSREGTWSALKARY